MSPPSSIFKATVDPKSTARQAAKAGAAPARKAAVKNAPAKKATAKNGAAKKS